MTWKVAAVAALTMLAIAPGVVTESADAAPGISTEAGFQAALDAGATRIRLAPRSTISIKTGLTHSGTNRVTISGRNATLDARFVPGDAMVFSGGGNITISHMSLINAPNRGIVIDVPAGATGNVTVKMRKVTVQRCDGIGVHLDDSDASAAGVYLQMRQCKMLNNGVRTSSGGTADQDAVRVDEAGTGDLRAHFDRVFCEGNKHDAIQVSESGDGNLRAFVYRTIFLRNGNITDRGDGINIDESGDGFLFTQLRGITATQNIGAGVDCSESGNGDAIVRLTHATVRACRGDRVTATESGDGDLSANFLRLTSLQNHMNGLELTESGAGDFLLHYRGSVCSKNKGDGTTLAQSGGGTGLAELGHVRLKLNRGENLRATGVTVNQR